LRVNLWPRHAIQTVVDGKRIDYVICLHCSEIGDAMPILDKYLKAASIPQAPEVGD
jgi:hypothetical protein